MTKPSLPTLKLVTALQAQGYKLVAGVDEVGRGCLAGPLVAGAVVLPDNSELTGVRDSKRLTPKTRVRLARDIKVTALGVGIGWVSAAEIDTHGLSAALRLASQRALADMALTADFVILDGKTNYLADFSASRAEVAADNHCLPVAAAAIVAKVARDSYMRRMERLLPGYGFETNMGYGTPAHLAALRQRGPSRLHRQSFEPLKSRLVSPTAT